MRTRKRLWRIFQSNPFWWLLSLLLFRQQLRPWVEAIPNQPRERLIRALAYSVALSVLLGAVRGRKLWPRVRSIAARLRPARSTTILVPSAISVRIEPSEPPPGRAGNITSVVLQPPPPTPELPLDSAEWKLSEQVRRFYIGRALAGRALLSPPSPSTALVLN